MKTGGTHSRIWKWVYLIFLWRQNTCFSCEIHAPFGVSEEKRQFLSQPLTCRKTRDPRTKRTAENVRNPRSEAIIVKLSRESFGPPTQRKAFAFAISSEPQRCLGGAVGRGSSVTIVTHLAVNLTKSPLSPPSPLVISRASADNSSKSGRCSGRAAASPRARPRRMSNGPVEWHRLPNAVDNYYLRRPFSTRSSTPASREFDLKRKFWEGWKRIIGEVGSVALHDQLEQSDDFLALIWLGWVRSW